MSTKFSSIIFLFICLVLPFACVVKKKKNETNSLGKFYHNTTAYYNGYWNANETLKESMVTLRNANVDDYSEILEVEDYVSLNDPKIVKADMDKIIEKVATVATLHEPSDWVDDCYVMMGKAQYLKQEYETAEETLEYFQEDFNPANPYGRNYKSKKLTGKAAQKAKEEEKKDNQKKKEEERENKEKAAKETAKVKEEAKKEEIAVKAEEQKQKEETRKQVTKTREQERKDREKEREQARKQKEKDQKIAAENRKKGIKTPKKVEPEKVQVAEVKQEPTKKVDTIKEEPAPKVTKPLKEEKKEEIAETDKPSKEDPKKEEKKKEDKTAYSNGLLLLAKTYIKRQNWFSAELILQKLEKSEISDQIRGELPATFASLYIKQEKYQDALPKLETAIQLEKNKQLKARYAFIAGQISQRINNNSKASEFFAMSKKYAKQPKMEFMASLAVSKNALLAGTKSKESILNDLKSMLKEVKFSDVQDQIYFTMAEIDLAQNNTTSALENLKNSIQVNKNDQKLKKESYYHIAKIYSNQENYISSALYYDSTLNLATSSDKNYLEIKKNAEYLKEIASTIEKVNYSDTLIYFSSLSDEDKVKIIPPYLQRTRKTTTKPTVAKENSSLESFTPRNVNFGNSNFFAYNTNSLARGKEDFEKTWGKIPLVDDWRRRSKASGSSVETIGSDQVKVAEDSGKQPAFDREEYDKFLKEVPSNPIRRKEVEDRLIQSLFDLGKLYREKINNYSKSIAALEGLVSRFKESPYHAEAYYYLYLNYLDVQNSQKAELYKNKILQEFPTSIYADIVKDPKYFDNNKVVDKIDVYYQKGQKLFESRKFEEAISHIDKSADNIGIQHNYGAKFALLRAMCIGGKDGKEAYITSLKDVVSAFRNTPEQLKASEILRFLGGDDNAFATVKEVDNIYEREPNSRHYIAIVTYGMTEAQQVNYKIAASEFNKKYFANERLQFGDASLNQEQNSHVMLVRTFENEAKALDYYTKVMANVNEYSGNASGTYDIFVMSQANYRKMLGLRDATTYRLFHQNEILGNSNK